MPAALRALLLLPALIACDRAPWHPTTDERTLLRRVSAQEPLGCADVERGVADPVAGLLAIIDHVPQGPPPIRAARCLVEGHLDTIEEQATRWLTEPGKKGLAIVVVDRLHTTTAPLAVQLGQIALTGPYADTLRPRLARSPLPAVAALALEVR